MAPSLGAIARRVRRRRSRSSSSTSTRTRARPPEYGVMSIPTLNVYWGGEDRPRPSSVCQAENFLVLTAGTSSPSSQRHISRTADAVS
ncbi:hypothetical protein [Streptomyces sp. KL116D]|uniref:hypothetical protein n=1 Tax=Streptomyces sp. KL116D TaxID=3045152 RepID=UPI00355685DE